MKHQLLMHEINGAFYWLHTYKISNLYNLTLLRINAKVNQTVADGYHQSKSKNCFAIWPESLVNVKG